MNLRLTTLGSSFFVALALTASTGSARAEPPKAASPPKEAAWGAFRPLPAWALHPTEFRSTGMMATGIIGAVVGTIAMGVGTGLWASKPCGGEEAIPVADGEFVAPPQCQQTSSSQTAGMMVLLTSAIATAISIPLIIVGSQRVRIPKAPQRAASTSFGVRPGPSGIALVF